MVNVTDYGQVDFRKQVIMLLPPLLRSETMVDWLHSLVYPLDSLMDSDWAFIYSQYVIGNLTGQKLVMQEGLNHLFGITTAPFIIIETIRGNDTTSYAFNEAEVSTLYAWNEAELPTVTWVRNQAESADPIGANFLVKMPTIYASTGNLARLTQLVTLIKPVGRSFKIITY